MSDYTPFTLEQKGVGVDPMQGKFDEMFGAEEEIVEEVKVKKPRKKAAGKTSSPKGKTV